MKQSTAAKNELYSTGYKTTHSYNDTQELRERLFKIQKSGYKAAIVEISTPSGRNMYEIFAERRYFTDTYLDDINVRLSRIDSEKALELTRYNEAIARIEEKKRLLEEQVAELQKELKGL